jgi:hypothetical protein
MRLCNYIKWEQQCCHLILDPEIMYGDVLSKILQFISKSRDSAVGIATGYVLDDQGVGVRVPLGKEFSLLHVVQTGSGVHPTSYPMGTGGSFSGGKAARA